MTGINPNLGKILNIKQSDLQATAKIDVNKPNEQEGNTAKPAAVWMIGAKGCDTSFAKTGDVIIRRIGSDLEYFRVGIDERGKRALLPMDACEDLRSDDFESDRGTFREPFPGVD